VSVVPGDERWAGQETETGRKAMRRMAAQGQWPSNDLGSSPEWGTLGRSGPDLRQNSAGRVERSVERGQARKQDVIW